MDDVFTMFLLGLVMYVSSKSMFSPAPLVLGLILGTLAEDNLSRGKIIASTGDGLFTYFFTGNVNLIVIALCAISLGWSIYGEYQQTRKNRLKTEVTP